jgi:hypothetical protein
MAEFFVLYSVSDDSTFQDHEDELTKAFAKLAYDDKAENADVIEELRVATAFVIFVGHWASITVL